MDLAGFFDTEQEVRSAVRYAYQNAEDRAVAAWLHAKQREGHITTAIVRGMLDPHKPPQDSGTATSTGQRYPD